MEENNKSPVQSQSIKYHYRIVDTIDSSVLWDSKVENIVFEGSFCRYGFDNEEDANYASRDRLDRIQLARIEKLDHHKIEVYTAPSEEPVLSVQPQIPEAMIQWSENLNTAINAIDAVQSLLSAGAVMQDVDTAIEDCKLSLDNMRKQVYAANTPIPVQYTEEDMKTAYVKGSAYREMGGHYTAARKWLKDYKPVPIPVDTTIEGKAQVHVKKTLRIPFVEGTEEFEIANSMYIAGYQQCQKDSGSDREYAKWIGSNEWIYYSGTWIMNNPATPEEDAMQWTDDQMYEKYLQWKASIDSHSK